jgi:hypothetical protein
MEATKSLTNLETFPPEMITLIMTFMNIKDAINIGKVNKYFRKIYLEMLNNTKYISNKLEPNLNVFIEMILKNVALGNRTLFINIPHCTNNINDIFQIINITSIPDHSLNLTLHLINENKTKIEIITFNSYYNIISTKNNGLREDNGSIWRRNFDANVKIITESRFKHKMRPLKVEFSKDVNSLVWNK